MSHTLPRPARVRSIRAENYRTKTLVLNAAIKATPGQFVMIWLPRLDEKPFAIVDTDPLAITVAKVGPFTQAVHQLQSEDRLWWRGPLGRGFEICGHDLLLVGGGYGTASLVLLAQQAIAQGRRVNVALGARTAEDLILVERFESLGAKLLLTTEDGSVGRPGMATDVVGPLLAAGTVDALYGCGPEGLLVALQELSRHYGISAQLSWEAYMRCGMGLCGSCKRGAQLVCQDGPVFKVRPSIETWTCQDQQSVV